PNPPALPTRFPKTGFRPGIQMQLRMSCNKSKHRSFWLDGCEIDRLAPGPHAGCAAPRLARCARRAIAVGCLRLGADRAGGLVLAQAAGVPRARLSRRGRLHGSRQLGDLARRWFEVRLRAADSRAAVEPDGDRAAIAVHAARRRRWTRPRAGLPRFLSA